MDEVSRALASRIIDAEQVSGIYEHLKLQGAQKKADKAREIAQYIMDDEDDLDGDEDDGALDEDQDDDDVLDVSDMHEIITTLFDEQQLRRVCHTVGVASNGNFDALCERVIDAMAKESLNVFEILGEEVRARDIQVYADEGYIEKDTPSEMFDELTALWAEIDDDDNPNIEDDDMIEAINGCVEGADVLDFLSQSTNAQIRGVTFILTDETSQEKKQNLFSHQANAVDKTIQNGWTGIVHLPTGSGKTRVGIELIRTWMAKSGGRSVFWVSEGLNLLRQGLTRICEQAHLLAEDTSICWVEPRYTLINSDGEPDDITVMTRADFKDMLDSRSKKTILARAKANGDEVLVIFDESHRLGSPAEQKIWRKRFGTDINQNDFKLVGLSATPIRTASADHEFQQQIFPMKSSTVKRDWGMQVHCSVPISHLVTVGTLCPIDTALQDTRIFDFTLTGEQALKRAANRIRNQRDAIEFCMDLNNKALCEPAVLQKLANQIAKNIEYLGKTLVFAPNINAANELTGFLKAKRVDVTVAHSKLNEFEDGSIDDDTSFADATLQIQEFVNRGSAPCVMVNVGMLTTGFDDPKIETVILARSTESTNLFWQMIGRGTRGPNVGGTLKCNIIDPVRLADRFGLNQYAPDIGVRDNTDQGLQHGGFEVDSIGEKGPIKGAPTKVSRKLKLSPQVQQALIDFLNGADNRPELEKAGIDPGDLLIGGGGRLDDDDDDDFCNVIGLPSELPGGKGLLSARHLNALKKLEQKMNADLAWVVIAEPVLDSSTVSGEAFMMALKVIEKFKLITNIQYQEKMTQMKQQMMMMG